MLHEKENISEIIVGPDKPKEFISFLIMLTRGAKRVFATNGSSHCRRGGCFVRPCVRVCVRKIRNLAIFLKESFQNYFSKTVNFKIKIMPKEFHSWLFSQAHEGVCLHIEKSHSRPPSGGVKRSKTKDITKKQKPVIRPRRIATNGKQNCGCAAAKTNFPKRISICRLKNHD